MSDADTRIEQGLQSGRAALAAADDMRAKARDILEQTDCAPLNDACHYLNWAIAAFERAAKQLEERS